MHMAWAGFDEADNAYKRGDYTTAFHWFSLLAEKGNARAQCAIGIMYEYGFGVAKDEQQAASWFRKAAEQSDSNSQLNLSLIYANGQGVIKDEQQAQPDARVWRP